MEVSLSQVVWALANSWDLDTAQDPVPGRGISSGQCAVSSMIIYELFGGEIWTCYIVGVKHYFNVFGYDQVYDSTRRQFTDEEYQTAEGHRRATFDEFVFQDTLDKYKILKGRVMRWVNG